MKCAIFYEDGMRLKISKQSIENKKKLFSFDKLIEIKYIICEYLFKIWHIEMVYLNFYNDFGYNLEKDMPNIQIVK